MALNIQKKVVGVLNQSHRILRAKYSYFFAIKSKDGKGAFKLECGRETYPGACAGR